MSGENPFAPFPKNAIEPVPISQIAKGKDANILNNYYTKQTKKVHGKNFLTKDFFADKPPKGKHFIPKGKHFIPRVTGKRRSRAKGASLPKAGFRPTLRKDEEYKKNNKSFDLIFDHNLANFRFHFCGSPLFSNELLQKFEKLQEKKEATNFSNKFEKFLSGVELQNRFGFRNQLLTTRSAAERLAIIENVAAACGNSPVSQFVFEFMNFMLSDTGDNSDILIMKKNGTICGVALVSKTTADEGYYDSFKLELLCSNGLERGGSFLLMVYLMALNARGSTTGFLQVAHGYTNMSALCLYNKFGFVEDPYLIDRYKQLYMKCELINKQDNHIYNTFLSSLPQNLLPAEGLKGDMSRNFKKTEPLCSDEFRSLPAEVQQGIINYRQDCLKTIRTEADVENIRKTTKKFIKNKKVTK